MSTDEMSPREVIVPIFGTRGGHPVRFLGTGSIIGDGSILLTADHVIRDWPDEFAIMVIPTGLSVFRTEVIERDQRHDLALLRVDEYRPPKPLQVLMGRGVSCNIELTTLEYGTTVVAGSIVSLNPAVRMGHKTRNVDAEALGPAGLQALELSFPALHGASGAPVLIDSTPYVTDEERWGIVGVIVANAAYHALPAQTVSVLYDDNSGYEEIKYMLPQALAVNIDHLRPMYERAMEAG